jgi:uncharacterized OB-fold protein
MLTAPGREVARRIDSQRHLEILRELAANAAPRYRCRRCPREALPGRPFCDNCRRELICIGGRPDDC